MKPKIIAFGVVVLGVGLTGIFASSVARPSSTILPGSLSGTGLQGLGTELIQGNIGTSVAFRSATRSSTHWWSAPGMTLKIRRNEREAEGSPWAHQYQELSASFHIVDARARGNSEIYVAGLYGNGEGTIEKWTFLHPARYTNAGNYVPLDQRRLPGVRRTVLYRGTSIGMVRSIETDPDNRFILALTQTPRALYKVLVEPPYSPELLHTVETLPELAALQTIQFALHASEGRKYILTKKERWRHSADGPLDSAAFVVALPDPANIGSFGVPQVLDPATWAGLGYNDPMAWTLWSSVGP